PSAGSDRGSKRRREGKEPESGSAPIEKATRSTEKSTQGSKSRQMSTSESATTEHQNTQQFGAMLPIVTNKDIRNSNAYKEYYAIATGATLPKPKASVQKTRSSSDTTVTPLTATAGPRLSTSAKGK
nr:hypothetical protein [Tanacetum cinerariifolium]